MAQRTRPERPRVQLRHRKRGLRNDTERLERLTSQLPGATGERPFSVATASVIAVKVRALRCLHCDGELDLLGDETAQKVNDEILRRVELTCRRCRIPRVAWFRIVPVLPS